MNKFCGKCGAPLSEEEKFCHKCGNPVDATEIISTNAGSMPNDNRLPEKKSKSKILVGVFIALFIVIAAGGVAFYIHQTNNQVTATEQDSQNSNEKQSVEDKSSQSDDSNKAIQQELDKRGISGEIITTTYGHNPNGCLILLGGKGQRLVVWDQKNARIAYVEAKSDLYNFIDKKGKPPVIFNLTVLQDTHDKDEQAGSWRGTDHFIPIYALYDLDKNGNVVPGGIYTGSGSNPAKYHSYLYEMKNVDMVNLVLTEMQTLRNNAMEKGIKLI